MITISVIIPVYKVEIFVRRCLESVIAQECDKFSIECLIIDDCTPDNSMIIVQNVINSYLGPSITFRVIHHDKNMGLSKARNTGIKAATGDFIYFVDSDDYIIDNAFKTFLAYFVRFPSVDLIVGNSLWVEKDCLTNTIANSDAPTSFFIEDKQKIVELMLRRHLDRHAWNKLVRRSLFVDNDLFFDAGLLYEDVTWAYKLYSCVSSVLIIPNLTYMYEYNPMSIVHTPKERSNQMVWSLVLISDTILKNPPIINGKKVLFVAHRLYVNYWFLQAMDLYDRYGADQETIQKMKSVKRTLLKDAICYMRPFLAIFFLIMFNPFNMLMKIRLLRSNIDRINRIVYKLS